MSKPDDLPADTPELEPAVSFDSARLIADVRRGEEAAIGEAYRLTFGNQLGRVVLLHALATIGRVGHPRDRERIEQANFQNGRASAVLEIAGLAGFDPVAIAAAGLTQTLEGAHYEQGYGHGSRHHNGGPIVDFGDGEHEYGGGYDGGGFDGGAGFDDGGPVEGG